jgi:hypothetical protein
MRQRVSRRMVVGGLGLAVLLSSAWTQAQDSAVLEAGFGAVRNKQRFLISGTLLLTEKESADFWPAYDSYMEEQQKLDQRSARLITELSASLAGLSEDRARALVDEFLSIEETQLKELRSHITRLKKILPAAKLARYVQLRNKLDVGVRHDLAQQIPLVQ